MRVLFVCVGNTCRSQMAEGWARHLGLEAASAGTIPGGVVATNAVEFMREQLQQRPSLRGLGRLLELEFSTDSGPDSDKQDHDKSPIYLLKTLIDQLLAAKAKYQCGQCGFAGKQLHWLCPGCKSWNRVRLIQGLEGD